MYGNEIQTPILPIDMCDQLAHNALQLRRVCERRTCNLDHDDVADPFWVRLEELLECAELERKLSQTQ